MSNASGIVETEFGGYPFLDDSFQPTRLMAAVACVRWQRARAGGLELSSHELMEMLNPAVALTIRQLDLRLDVEWAELDTDQEMAAAAAFDLVCSSVPQWAGLMRVPLRFGRMPTEWGAVSSSAFAWPQHIWLSGKAFASLEGLAEQIVHEVSHQWLYFIEELTPLQDDGTNIRVALPSGTTNRTVSELLGALHVSINLRRLWSVIPVDEGLRRRRLEHLDFYITGCLKILEEVEHALTDEGRGIAIRLREGADS